MGRWEPDAAGRLREAAMELFLEQGYEQTTVAEIAGRAGLTARTFFRYFADKREVLFGGWPVLEQQMVGALEAAPKGASPMVAVAAALAAAADLLGARRDVAQRRLAVINANAELLERELIKMAWMAAALSEGLRRRGVAEPEASLAAEAGVAVLRVAFERWAGAGTEDDAGAGPAADRSQGDSPKSDSLDLGALVTESLAHLRSVTAAP